MSAVCAICAAAGRDHYTTMSALVIVQARMGSTRLPGKVLLELGGHPVLWHVMERVKRAGYPYVLTIPDAATDDALSTYAVSQGWPVNRGPHPDMVSAYRKAWAESGEQDIVVRVTADCPFVQPAAIHQYGRFCSWYASNAHPHRRVPKGLDVEVFSPKMLAMVDRQATGDDRHHVTPWMRRYFDQGTSTDDGEFRVTLDTPEDYDRLKWIAARVSLEPPHPTTDELRALLV